MTSEPKVVAQHDQVTNEICLPMNEAGERKRGKKPQLEKEILCYLIFSYIIRNWG